MDKIDPNHDLVPTLRMMDGLLFDRAADEIEKWRDAYRKAVQTPAAELMVVGPGWHERFPVITAPIVIDGLLQVHVSDRRDDMADELTRLRAENAALIAERAAPVQPVQAPMTERERRAPARREEMAAFAAELKADPAKAQAFFQEAGILDASGNLMPQYGVQAQGEPVLYRKHLSGLDAYIYRDAPRDDKREAWEPLFLHPPRADAEIAPIGPREPDTTMVICPACASQFRAIPVEVQEEVERLRAALEEVLVYGNGAKGFIADSVRKIAQRALRGD